MGLDMYLRKKVYVGANYEHRNVTGEINIKVGKEKLNIDFNKVVYIEESAGYWRKANQIHKWFVDNVQNGNDDCENYYVDQKKLKELLEIVNTLLTGLVLEDGEVNNGERYEKATESWIPIMETGKVITNPELAEELLPSGGGFFFGSTNYDMYYYQDLLDTKEILENALKDESGEFYYHSSW